LNALAEFGIISYAMLLATALISFFLAQLSPNSNEIIIILDLIVGMTLLLLIVIIYFVYERRGNDSNSGLINLAVLPYTFEDLIFWAGYISTVGFILALILAPFHILLNQRIWIFNSRSCIEQHIR
jgi:hypothetical protein